MSVDCDTEILGYSPFGDCDDPGITNGSRGRCVAENPKVRALKSGKEQERFTLHQKWCIPFSATIRYAQSSR